MLICLFHALHGSAVGISCDDKALGVAAYLLTIGVVAAEDGAVACGCDALHGSVDGDMESVGLQILELLTVHIDNESVIAFLEVDKDCCQFTICALKFDVVVGRNLGQCDVVFCLVGTESFHLLVEDTH